MYIYIYICIERERVRADEHALGTYVRAVAVEAVAV